MNLKERKERCTVKFGGRKVEGEMINYTIISKENEKYFLKRVNNTQNYPRKTYRKTSWGVNFAKV